MEQAILKLLAGVGPERVALLVAVFWILYLIRENRRAAAEIGQYHELLLLAFKKRILGEADEHDQKSDLQLAAGAPAAAAGAGDCARPAADSAGAITALSAAEEKRP